MTLGFVNYTAASQSEADAWFSLLDSQLQALQQGAPPERYSWCEGNVAEQDPATLSMSHSTTLAGGWVFCVTAISIPD